MDELVKLKLVLGDARAYRRYRCVTILANADGVFVELQKPADSGLHDELPPRLPLPTLLRFRGLESALRCAASRVGYVHVSGGGSRVVLAGQVLTADEEVRLRPFQLRVRAERVALALNAFDTLRRTPYLLGLHLGKTMYLCVRDKLLTAPLTAWIEAEPPYDWF